MQSAETGRLTIVARKDHLHSVPWVTENAGGKKTSSRTGEAGEVHSEFPGSRNQAHFNVENHVSTSLRA